VRYEFRHVALVLECVASANASTAGLLEHAGLVEADAVAPSVVGPPERIEALVAEAGRSIGEPSFGLALATHVQRGRFGWIEFAARSAESIAEGLRLLVVYSALLNREAGYAFAVRDGEGVLTFETPGRSGGLGPQLNELTIAIVLGVLRSAAGSHVVPRRAWFAHDAATSPAIAEWIGARLGFGQPSSGFTLDRAIAEARHPTHDPALHGLLRARLDELLPAATSTRTMTARVRGEVIARLGQGRFGLSEIAVTLGVSTRTLQRELADEGVTFAEIVDGSRRELAERLLARDDLTLGQIATYLGYADLRGFERAYVRWTGQTIAQRRTS
jgi:AraC-like DNA-binding protein